ncbi:MAG: AAA family ATPase [Endomicrobiia bacterium]|nr:MAG: AAA family ATPase [Endomicrobiia bacterium]
MKEIVAIVNQKGGTGKTTTTHALGAGLIRKGYRVLLIDMDGQANLTDTMQADQSNGRILDLLMKRVGIKEIVQKTAAGDILAGSEDLFQADVDVTGHDKEYRLREALSEVKQDYDYVIIDTSHVLGILAINALIASNSVIIASHAEGYNLTGAKRLGEIIIDVNKHDNKDLIIRGILLTRFKERTRLNKDLLKVIEELAKELDTKLYKTTIREAVAISEGQIKHLSIFDYAPNSNVAKDYEAFVEEFLQTNNGG